MTDNTSVQATISQPSAIAEIYQDYPHSLTELEERGNYGETLKHQESKKSTTGFQTKVLGGDEGFRLSTNSILSNKLQDVVDLKLKKPRKKPSPDKKITQTAKSLPTVLPLELLPDPSETSMNPTRLFIASLGNPPPYSSTRHSAGHILLKALNSQLHMPPFQKSKPFANGLTSFGADINRPEFTLWQSPSLMNVSGVALLKAYKHFVSSVQMSPSDPLPGLVVLYDEMETNPSQLRLRRGATSAKGHNGLKSVQQSLQGAGLMDKLNDRFVKIGIGIGRPAGGSRTSEDVSQYVLGQVTANEKGAIDAKVPELVKMLDVEATRMSN